MQTNLKTSIRFYETPEYQPISDVIDILCFEGFTPGEILEDELDGELKKYVEVGDIDQESAKWIAHNRYMWLETVITATA